MKEYFLIEESVKSEFDDKVSQFLVRGWRLYGNPFFTILEHRYCQAVTK